MNPRLLILVIAASPHAYAINKCTGADGKASYQEAPCGDAARAQKIDVPSARPEPEEMWLFSREKDDMTGKTTCFAVSPSGYISWGFGSRNSTNIRVQLAVGTEFSGALLTIRSTTGGPVFHNNLAGTGMKVDGQPFVELTTKHNAHALGPAPGSATDLLGIMQNGKSFRVRVRMWPYEQLIDTRPIPLAGYESAVKRAMLCAGE